MAAESQFAELIDKSLPRDEARRLRLFAQKLFAREPADFGERMSPAARLALARSAYEFFLVRAEPITVRVVAALDGESVTVIESAMPDCPFIVDSLLEYLHAIGAPVRVLLHPIYRVARDSAGRIVSFEQAHSAERGESLVHAELEQAVTAERARAMEREIAAVMREVRDATADFDATTARALAICEATAQARELVEVRDFLRWLVQGGFVFLGYRRFLVTGSERGARFEADAGSELGILRERDEPRFRTTGSFDELTPGRRKLVLEGPPLIISKSRVESHVHRRRPMDSIAIRRTTAAGRVESFDHFLGLFTSKAYAEEAQHIPLLRAKLRELLDAEGAEPGSHDYKEIVATFNSFPKDELFRAPVAELREQIRLILDVKSEAEVRLRVLADQYRGNVITLVVMPRDAFSAEVRQRIQARLGERLGGTLVYYYLALGEGYTARLHFCFAAEPPKQATIRELESEVARLARRWEDRLRDQAMHQLGAARGRALFARWAQAFGPDYKAATSIERALADIERIEALLESGALAVATGPHPDHPGASELRMLGLGDPPMLSDLMPMLQNFSLSVLSEHAHVLTPDIGGRRARAYVHAFAITGPDRQPLATLPGAAVIAGAIAAVRSHLAEDDPLNALALTAGLAWREVALLRAYLAAAFQMRLAPARPALRRVMLQHPELARLLIRMVGARLEPEPAGSEREFQKLSAAYLESLGAIDNIADDRIARALHSMVEATVRANCFLEPPAPDPYIALKFESARILGLPDTPPLYEIHVNSPRMEGCHLRSAKIARGGIRFSDRPDDYRTEILGLMKTQTVKNAIIVPMGSKGGFIVKPQPGRPPAPDDGVDAYRTLINAMLDLTDNVTDKGIVHPAGVKVLDTDGPYLVVAADKGTAAFSDLANEIAGARGFWLGDAFASGGRHGYDHKRIGITARGAWESARRHLREMNRDPDHGPPITMIGIGDMSGDVFGNGLLQSRSLKLIAAFDHRHIFIDPDPDPEKSFAERKRLFELPHSQWSDYNPALLSAGGGVYRRGQKRIELSPEARTALGSDAPALDGESLISVILRAPVEILYNGGIGTYVRASDETDAAVGDHANDGCRITAPELRAKIVVEGGNLGFTQKARIEYAIGGGRINTDAIDNSAGVDTSDHEVNLKILLAPALARGQLKFAERNRLLAECTDEVAAGGVLRDNRDQALSLSLEQIRSRTEASSFRDHLQAIEERGLLRRHEEALPTREALRERRARYPGLTRPELAVLGAYTKIDLKMRLEPAPLVNDPYLVGRYLATYFPKSFADRFAGEIPRHQLRRDLIATRMVNEMVDLMGSIFVFSLVRDHAADAVSAVRAWCITDDLLGINQRAERLKQEAAAISADAELAAFLALERAGRTAAAWALEHCDPGEPIGAEIARFRPGFGALASRLDDLLTAGERERFERLYRELRTSTGDGELAHTLARLAFADHLLTVLGLSFERKLDADAAAEAYFGLGARLDFSSIENALAAMTSDDNWERRAVQELTLELRTARIGLCVAALEGGGTAPAAIERMLDARAARFAEASRLIGDLRSMSEPTQPAIHVTVRALSRLAQGR